METINYLLYSTNEQYEKDKSFFKDRSQVRLLIRKLVFHINNSKSEISDSKKEIADIFVKFIDIFKDKDIQAAIIDDMVFIFLELSQYNKFKLLIQDVFINNKNIRTNIKPLSYDVTEAILTNSNSFIVTFDIINYIYLSNFKSTKESLNNGLIVISYLLSKRFLNKRIIKEISDNKDLLIIIEEDRFRFFVIKNEELFEVIINTEDLKSLTNKNIKLHQLLNKTSIRKHVYPININNYELYFIYKELVKNNNFSYSFQLLILDSERFKKNNIQKKDVLDLIIQSFSCNNNYNLINIYDISDSNYLYIYTNLNKRNRVKLKECLLNNNKLNHLIDDFNMIDIINS